MALGPLPLEGQPFLRVQAIHAFVVQLPSLPLHQDMKPSVPIPYPGAGQLTELASQNAAV